MDAKSIHALRRNGHQPRSCVGSGGFGAAHPDAAVTQRDSPVRTRAHASNLFIPPTHLWAALKSCLLLGQAGFGSRNLPEISPKHRITDLYAWTLPRG